MSVVQSRPETHSPHDGAPSLDEAIDQLIALGHQARPASGTPLDSGPGVFVTHSTSAGVQDIAALQRSVEDHTGSEGGTLSDSGQARNETHSRTAGVRNLSEVVA